MSALATWIGWVVMAAGGVALAAVLLSLALMYAWGEVKALYGWPWLVRAIRAHKEVSPWGESNAPVKKSVAERNRASQMDQED